MKSATFAFVILLILLVAGAIFFTSGNSYTNSQNAQAMALQGKWLGMTFASSADFPTAAQMGVIPSIQGAVVAELDGKNAWRARQAGMMLGDIIVGVNGKKVQNLTDLYDVTLNLDPRSTILFDIQRWGQPMQIMLPALFAAPSIVGQPRVY